MTTALVMHGLLKIIITRIVSNRTMTASPLYCGQGVVVWGWNDTT